MKFFLAQRFAIVLQGNRSKSYRYPFDLKTFFLSFFLYVGKESLFLILITFRDLGASFLVVFGFKSFGYFCLKADEQIFHLFLPHFSFTRWKGYRPGLVRILEVIHITPVARGLFFGGKFFEDSLYSTRPSSIAHASYIDVIARTIDIEAKFDGSNSSILSKHTPYFWYRFSALAGKIF